MVKTSPADAAYETLVQFIEAGELTRFAKEKLSESDTRSKLIDPLFRHVLGWPEAEIRREKPVASGFVDYVLGAEFAYLLIEAKRTNPRFRLKTEQKARRLKLGGPHLLGDKKLRVYLEQARNYAVDLGAQFALLTNGVQFILFQPYLPGRGWEHGVAIVFHDFADIQDEFQEFYALLSREAVCSGAIIEAFERLEGVTSEQYRPLDFVQNPDAELIRNPFWTKMSHIVGPLFADVPADEQQQLEIIRHCYVTTPLSDQADDNLDRLLRDTVTPFLDQVGIAHVIPSAKSDAFSHQFRTDVQMVRPGTYVLTGGVGSGKTTFLKRFANIVARGFVQQYCVWLHVDFLPAGNLDHANLDAEIRRYTYSKIRERLQTQYPERYPKTGDEVRDLFSDEIQKATLTLLHGISQGSELWTREVNRIVDDLFADDAKVAHALLTRLRKSGLRTVVVFDNTDQLGEIVQERVFLLAQKVAADYAAFCVVALREEKFFAAYRRGIFDAFGDRRFHIGSPDLSAVLRKRLEYGRKKVGAMAVGASKSTADDTIQAIDTLLDAIIASIQKNADIVRMLACVSNGDMRYALDMFRAFVSSGNTNIEKILDATTHTGGYTVPFHEFAKSAILGSRRYFRGSVSHIVNVFAKTEARSASHVTALRVLARLSAAEGAASPHGPGFVSVPKLLREYRESFGLADDFGAWCDELLRRGLIVSEPPKASDLERADAVRIAAAGSYYWKYLVRSFAYVDLVYADTPVADQHLAERLAALADSHGLEDRIARVTGFLDYLAREEAQELLQAARRSGPYVNGVLSEVRGHVDVELARIQARFSRRS
jgi:hypothetical protein